MNQRFASDCGPRRSSKRIRGDEVAPEQMDIDHQQITPARAASGITRSCMRARFKIRVVHSRWPPPMPVCVRQARETSPKVLWISRALYQRREIAGRATQPTPC